MSSRFLSEPQVINTSIPPGVLVTFAVLLRVLARWNCKAKFGADDWAIMLSLGPFYMMIGFGVARK